LIRLILDAGANPNFYSDTYRSSLFGEFLAKKKSYVALEIAKTEGFTSPKDSDEAFNHLASSLKFYLQWGRPCPGDTKEETDLIAQNCSDRRDLTYHLFQKGFYPHDEKVFQALVPIVLEKDPEFFDKRKKQVASQIMRAKTPIQIYNAIMGQEKEKN